MGMNYPVTIKTGDRSGAGTDANVYIQIHGDLGSTSRPTLDKSGYDDFERNDQDTYNVWSDVNIGIPERVDIGHDDANAGSAWYLDWVKVKDPSTGKEHIFNCYNWIDSSKGLDKTLDRSDGVPKPDFEPRGRTNIPLGVDYKILDWRNSEVEGYIEKVTFSVEAVKSETGETVKTTENTLSTEVSVGGGSTVQVSAKVAAELKKTFSDRRESTTSLKTTSTVEQTFTPQVGKLLFLTIHWQRSDEYGVVKRNGREFPYTMTVSYSSSQVTAESYNKGQTLPSHVTRVINSNLASEYIQPKR